MVKTELKFYDVKKKKSFMTSTYRTTTVSTSKGNKKFAVAKSPYTKGLEAWRVLGNTK